MSFLSLLGTTFPRFQTEEFCLRLSKVLITTDLLPYMRFFRSRRQLRKLYLNEAMDATQAIGDGGEDAGALQNKIDSLKFELRMANTDKRKLSEERDSLAAKNLALKEDAVRSERTKNEAREETANLKTQMRYMQVGQFVVLIISVPIV